MRVIQQKKGRNGKSGGILGEIDEKLERVFRRVRESWQEGWAVQAAP